METLGKYQIVEKVGVGGFGVVYKGYDPFIKRHVAIKTCSVEDTETRQRFQREAEIAGSLQHRNIVTVFEFGFEGDTPYLVQEYLSGEDLDRKIKRNEYVPLPEKILWLIQAARGLAFAHEHGIVHRDVKPANVRILDDGSAKLLDFGIAKLAHQPSSLTQVGMTLGTAAYLAPEQIRGQAIDARTDVFSFGVLAYELLAYERPFRAAEISAIFYKILHETPASLAARVPDLPVELDRVVARCLEKDPLKRWAPTGELVHALEKLMQKRPGATTLESFRAPGAATEVPTRIVPRPPDPSRAAPAAAPASGPARPAPPATPGAPRPSLDDIGFHYSDSASRVQSRSMAATTFGAGRTGRAWRWAAGLAAAAAAAAIAAWAWNQYAPGATLPAPAKTPPAARETTHATPAAATASPPAGAGKRRGVARGFRPGRGRHDRVDRPSDPARAGAGEAPRARGRAARAGAPAGRPGLESGARDARRRPQLPPRPAAPGRARRRFLRRRLLDHHPRLLVPLGAAGPPRGRRDEAALDPHRAAGAAHRPAAPRDALGGRAGGRRDGGRGAAAPALAATGRAPRRGLPRHRRRRRAGGQPNGHRAQPSRDGGDVRRRRQARDPGPRASEQRLTGGRDRGAPGGRRW